MEYYVEYKTHDETGWQRFNDTPFDVDACAIDVALKMFNLIACDVVRVREVRVIRQQPTEIWRNGYKQ